jgi:TPR repeat protein
MGVASSSEKREEANGDECATKRQKSFTDELTCPITLELPFDPVTAEDGRVYERSAIEKHIKGKSRASQMGKRLLPAVQQKNLIQSMIETKVITGELADSWNKRAAEKKEMDDLIKRAESGDGNAMAKLGYNYMKGKNGFKKDPKMAYTWNKKAHESGMFYGTVLMGWALLYGQGVTRCEKEGIMFMTMAAAQGSDYASFELGRALADGLYGLPVNKAEAIKWLQKSLSADCTEQLFNMTKFNRERAEMRLQELIDETA